MMRRLLCVAVAVAAATSMLVGCTALLGQQPLTASDARAVGADLLVEAEAAFASDTEARYCEQTSDDVLMCDRSWQAWMKDNHGLPEISSTTFEVEELTDESFKLVFSGVYQNGGDFQSEVEVVSVAGKPRAVDGVFWLDRTITAS